MLDIMYITKICIYIFSEFNITNFSYIIGGVFKNEGDFVLIIKYVFVILLYFLLHI